MEGLVNFYKPKGWRNFEILKFFKQLSPTTEKIGHGGTLDPLAEGVMVIGFGRKFTKKLQEVLLQSKKEYLAEIELGKVSNTYDAEGPLETSEVITKPTEKEITKVIENNLLGQHTQIPPLFSAKKIGGQRAADIARTGKTVKLRPQIVTLFSYKILDYHFPNLKLKLLVSSGFYIRSFIHTLGQKVKTGAYLKKLKRTAIYASTETFSANQSLTPADFQEKFELKGWVNGNVQGVGFRFFLYNLARKLDITGTVTNQPDGSVSFTAQGKKESIEQFAKQAKYGPASAKVDDYSFIYQKPKVILNSFTIL